MSTGMLSKLEFVGRVESVVKKREVGIYRSDDGTFFAVWPSTAPRMLYVHHFLEEDIERVRRVVQENPGTTFDEIGERTKDYFDLRDHKLGILIDSILLTLKLYGEVTHEKRGRVVEWYPVVSEEEVGGHLISIGVEEEVIEDYFSRLSDEDKRKELPLLLTMPREEREPEPRIVEEEEVDWGENKTFALISGRYGVHFFTYQRPLVYGSERRALRSVGLDPEEHSVLTFGYKNKRISHTISRTTDIIIDAERNGKKFLDEPVVSVSELKNYGVGFSSHQEKEKIVVYAPSRFVERCADVIKTSPRSWEIPPSI